MAGPWEQYQASDSKGDSSKGDPMDYALSQENISGPKADFIKSIYQQESGSGKNTKTSNAGAEGGMQIIPSTFKSVADQDWDIKDPYHNAQAGARYAAQMYDKAGGDPKVAAAGYYGGPGGLSKAKEGIAVSDPRNPKAPNTLQYGEQVASRMGKDEARPWESYAKSEEKPSAMPQEKSSKDSPLTYIKDTAASAGKNVLAGADVALSLPASILGPVASSVGRWVAIAKGAETEDVSKFGHEFGSTVAEKLSNPIHKMLDAVGFDYGYSETGVGKAMNKVSEIINNGAEWLQKRSGGVLSMEDAQDLTNAASMLVAPGAIRLTAKALLASGRAAKPLFSKAPAEEATLREVNDKVDAKAPAAATATSTPETLAKQHIEETTGITASKERTPEYEKQRLADVRAAFTEDPQYADYLKNYAEKEATARDSKVQIAADKIEAQNKANSLDPSKSVKEPATTWNDVLPILKKPGFQRTPEDIIKLRAFDRQKGSVDPEMLAKMAAVGLGVTAGLYLDPDHPIEGALLGAVGGFVATKLGNASTTIRKAFSPDKRIRVTEIGNDWESSIGKAGRAIWQEQSGIMESAKTVEGRSKVTKWMQGDKTVKLTDGEYAAAVKARDFFNRIGDEGLKSGVLTNLIPDYVTNLWDLEGSNKAAWDKISTNMSKESKFNIQRKITSIEEGKKMGLKPITEDIATIMGIYGNSLSKTMANKKLINTLEGTVIGNSLVLSADQAPKNYVAIDHPQMRGKLVHPDIKKSLEFIFSQRSPTGILAGMEGLNTAVKRLNVAFSLFHAKALGDAFIGAGGNPLKLPGIARGTNKYLQMIRDGGAGDIIDKAYEGGLKFSYDKGSLAVEDVGGSFYKGMDVVRRSMDEVIPGSGSLVKGFENVNRGVDTIMWDRLHAGMKLEIFAANFEKLKQNNIEAHAKDPKVPLKTDKEISGIAGSFSNDIFGGLNWRRAAEETKTVFARDVALTVASPGGRRVMQMLMFAPDWTFSTTRSAVKAFGKGSEIHGEGVIGKVGAGLKGLVKPQELADLHRQYLLRSAMYYFTVGNALNYAMSGHSILQNKDPTQLELGDGRTMQFSKHMMEPVHWVTKPGQQALNKLGILPSEIAQQLSGKEYLSTKGAPPMDTSAAGRIRHVLKKAIPITGQSKDVESGVSSALGFPIGGRTPKQMEADKEARKEARRKEREKANK